MAFIESSAVSNPLREPSKGLTFRTSSYEAWREELDQGRLGEALPGPVGGHPGNVSPFGVREMAGNVWEWTATVLEGLNEAVICGGSFDNPYRAGQEGVQPRQGALRGPERGHELGFGERGRDEVGCAGFPAAGISGVAGIPALGRVAYGIQKRRLTVSSANDAGLSSFQWPSETTSMLSPVTLTAV